MTRLRRDITIALASFLTSIYVMSAWLLRDVDLNDYR